MTIELFETDRKLSPLPRGEGQGEGQTSFFAFVVLSPLLGLRRRSLSRRTGLHSVRVRANFLARSA
jgi:hypothetical protein